MANFPHMGLIGSLLADEKKKRRDQFAAGQDWEMSALPTKKERLDESIGQIGKGAASLGSTTLDILHQLGRPGSGVLSGVKALQKAPVLWNPNLAIQHPGVAAGQIKKVGTAIKKGFTYETETRGQDFLSKEFRKKHPFSAGTLGFIIDVGSDPLTFGAGKLITKPIEAASRKLVEAAMKNPKIAERVSRLSESELAQAFNIHVGDAKVVKDASQKYRDKLKGAQLRAERDMHKRMIEVKQIASEAKVSVDDLNRAILNDIETGALGTADSLTSKIGPAAARIAKEDKAMYDEIIRLEQDAGIKIGDIMDRADEITGGYVPHIATAAARKIVEKQQRAAAANRPVSNIHAQRRQTKGTIEEINKANTGNAEKFLHDDPAYLRAVRSSRSAQELAYVNYNRDMRQRFGALADEGGKFPAGHVGVDGIEGVKFPAGLAKIIKRQRDILRNTTELDSYLKYADNVQNMWKMWSLGVRPAYHARNVAGNLWNAYSIAGVKNPMVFNKARQMQILALQETNPALAKKLGAGIDAGSGRPHVGTFNWDEVVTASDGSTKTMKELFEAAMDRGVIGKGQYGVGTDVAFNLERDLERAATGGLSGASPADIARQLTTPTTENAVLRAGFKVGNVLEDNARLGVFLNTFKKTGSLDGAASMVKKALFDYSDLSPFERTVMKRVMPFYTWSRKNIPAQIKALWSNPERARKVDILRHNIEHEEGRPDHTNVYDFYNKGVPIYLGETERGDVWEMYRLLNYLPLADIERVTEGGQAIQEMTTPLIKAPYEMMRNYDTFRRKQIEEYKGQTTDFLGVRMPKRLAHLAQLLVPVAEMNRANPFGMFGEAYKDEDTGEWKRSKSWGMSQPLIEFEVPKSITPPGLKTIVGGKYSLGGQPRESTRDQPRGVRFMQYSLGLRPYYVDESKGELYKRKNFERDLRSLKYYLKQAEKKGMSRRAGEINSLITQWKVQDKLGKAAEGRGESADYSFKGSRYYEK
tara:strand:+ start:2200 stop:5154 length:2955 start_codon:yes stop_codon:yes gene_type:complete